MRAAGSAKAVAGACGAARRRGPSRRNRRRGRPLPGPRRALRMARRLAITAYSLPASGRGREGGEGGGLCACGPVRIPACTCRKALNV